MGNNVYDIVSFLLPLAASMVCFLLIVQFRQKGISRQLFAALFVCFGLHFFYELAIQIDIITLQPIFYLIFLPASYAIGPLLYIYNQSLLKKGFKMRRKLRVHFIPSFLLFLGSIAMLTYYGNDNFGVIISDYSSTELPKSVNQGRILFLLAKTTIFYVHLLIYYFLIGRDQNKHKRKYGKFYADYEKKNEQLLFRIFLSLLGIIITQLVIQVLKLNISLIIVVSNLFSAILIAVMFFAGKKQIEIRKYRMYKLSSHEHEIKK